MRPDERLLRDYDTLSLELLFAVADLEAKQAPKMAELADAVDQGSFGVSDYVIRSRLAALTEEGYLETSTRIQRGVRGRNPTVWSLTGEGRTVLRDFLEARARALHVTDGEWEVIFEREDDQGDRFVDEAFCTNCGRLLTGQDMGFRRCADCRGEAVP